MSSHLWPYLRLTAKNDDELKEAYRKVFIENYIKNNDGHEITIHDWHGNRIYFDYLIFNHAFSESSNYRFGFGDHDIDFSKRRARCILWIKEVLSGVKGTIESYNQTRRNSRGKSVQRRVLLVVEESYIVVLEKISANEMKFISAFPADRGYVQRLKRQGGLAEIKSPSLIGD